jgi:subtilisin family serine protease/PKD repeat protein
MKKFLELRGLFMVLVIGVALAGPQALAQPSVKSFRFPASVTASDYDHRFVLAKLKTSHRDVLRQSAGRTVTGLSAQSGFLRASELLPARVVMAARGKKGPRRRVSSVDTELYYRIHCTPGTSIEEFINALYSTGHFERVEPEYVNKLLYTPNDPSITNQYYLGNIRALEAWDQTKGNTDITIAIVDSGGDLVHEDLAANIRTLADPVDGTDNDGNGWIDDSQGWDFVGETTVNLNDPNFIGDNNPQLLSGGNVGHGVSVAGCASGVADNTIGIAGVGFKTKLLFTKHSPDNDPASTSIYLGYDGVLYAALSGADIINCSWGGPNRSEIIQDMINFITEDLGALVVAAAGNSGKEQPFYPAAYQNVLSVAAVTQTNAKANFSNFGSYIDVAAPGVGIYTTAFGSLYTTIQGTSFSSPITAGAAALVMDKFPAYTPQQIAEQIRVTSNATSLYTANPGLVGKMGFGVLDVYSAITKVSPSVRAAQPRLLNASGSPAQQGQTGYLTMTFKNILAATSSALEISLVENSAFISVTKGTIRPGAIPAGGSLSNTLSPFEIQIAAFVPDNFEVPITIKYKDGTYQDQEEITFLLNPTFIDVDENLVTTTVSNTGRVGFEDTESSTRTKGLGFVFDGNSVLYEMGVIMGTGTGTQLYNNVRGINGNFDQDFVSVGPRISESVPGARSASEISGTLSNSSTPATQAFQLDYRSLAWKDAPYDKFVILEYTIKNPTANPINNFFFGMFADWDITDSGTDDIAKWDNDNKLGYVYPNTGSALPHTGIQLLTGTPSYYAIDNDQAVAGGSSFGLYDGFTDAEKFLALNSGLGRVEAGVSAGGSDVSHVVGAGPFTIPAGQQIVVAFALHAAHNLNDLKISAQQADTAYNYMLAAPKPVVAEASACYGGSATISATGASSYHWYTEFTGGTPFHTGASYTTGNLFRDTTYYVSNADDTYESVRTAAKVSIKASPGITTSGSTLICGNEILTLAAEEADSYLWSTGATTQSIQVNAAGNYSVTVTSLSPSCQNTSAPVTVSVLTPPVAAFTTTGDLKTYSPISFNDESTGAVAWTWDFGNGQTSTEQNPTVNYTQADPYDITLMVVDANGCRDTLVQSIAVITGLDESPGDLARIYPNPTRGSIHVILDDGYMGPRSVELLTLQGKSVYQQTGLIGSRLDINPGECPDGIYLIRIRSGTRTVNRKVVKIH